MRPEITRARRFRSGLSEPEVLLWSRLKRLRERGFHVRRQAPFRGYFLDFVCYTRCLVIEVDGGQHADAAQADHDLVRDKILRNHVFFVLRFGTGRVRRDLDGVMSQIVEVLEAAPSTRPANHDARSLGQAPPP